MKRLLILLLLALPGLNLRAELACSLLPPGSALVRGTDNTIELAALNRGLETESLRFPGELRGTLTAGGQNEPVVLVALENPPAKVASGGFAILRYRLVLPNEVASTAVLAVEVPGHGTLRSVYEPVAAASEDPIAMAPKAPAPTPAQHTLAPAATESPLQRYFAERFGPHEPVYFIYGPDDPVAKLQFSLKYRLLEFAASTDEQPRHTLQFGYTQRSLWDIEAKSSPFYDTSYMPELFYEALAPTDAASGEGLRWLGLQTGFQHESNGRDALRSRSLNTVYLRSYFLIGPAEGWHAVVAPELFVYVSGLEDNPRLKDYRGFGRLRVALSRGNGPSLQFTGFAGKDFEHPTVQLDLTVPLKLRLFNFKTFVLVQYFDGYGESLLDYDEHSRTVRAGMALIR